MYNTTYQFVCLSCNAWTSTLGGNTMYDEFDAHRATCTGGAHNAQANTIVMWSPDA